MEHDSRSVVSAPDRPRDALRLILQAPDSYGLVLGLLVLSFILAPLAQSASWLWVRVLVQGATVLFALHTSRVRPRTFRVAALIVAASLALAVIATVAGGDAHSQAEVEVLLALLFAMSVPAMLRRILTSSQVDIEVVVGALDVYIIFGLFFAALYSAIGGLAGTPFFTGHQDVPPGSYQFFSFVTLTTVGYGNLVPEAELGQSLAVMEALFGQVYLVTLVARLVSAWHPGTRRRPAERLLDERGTESTVGGHPLATASPAEVSSPTVSAKSTPGGS